MRVRAAFEDKRLELDGLEHWTEFFTRSASAVKRFFDHARNGADNSWNDRPLGILLRTTTLHPRGDRSSYPLLPAPP